ncbi:MAG: hypothetical protein ACYC0V_10265 [Armatimonadota bacterium]
MGLRTSNSIIRETSFPKPGANCDFIGLNDQRGRVAGAAFLDPGAESGMTLRGGMRL